MTILRKFFVSALLASAFFNLSLGTRLEAAPALAPRNQDKATSKITKSDVKAQVHRFDFRLEGVSCGRCIVNIRKALRLTKGVSRCELALRKPYGGVVIYDQLIFL